MGVRKTVRARKARRTSTCPACHGPVKVGDLISSVNSGPWKHADCGRAADRQAAAVAARYGRPVDVLRPL
jgi:hypothetical protein